MHNVRMSFLKINSELQEIIVAIVSNLFLVLFAKLREAIMTASSLSSARQFAVNNSAPTGRTLIKFDI